MGASKNIKTEEKPLGKRIESSIQYGTKYAMQQTNHIEIRKDETKTTNREQLSDMRIRGDLKLHHAFILRAVHTLGCATSSMVYGYLKNEKKFYPQKDVPEYGENETKTRLKFLAGVGLLVCYDYVCERHRRPIKLYSCTPYGHNVYRNMLNLSVSYYDENVIFRAEMEMFKRLAANSVCLALGTGESCDGIYFNGKYGFNKFPKIKIFMYGGADYGEKFYLVEPVYFRADSRIETDEENREKVAKRLLMMDNIVSLFKSEYEKQVQLILCVEDMQGLKLLSDILKGFSDENDIFSSAMFTCENIFFQNKNNLNESFLRRIVDGEKVTFIPAADKWREI